MSMACDLCGQKKISGGAKGVVATRSASAQRYRNISRSDLLVGT